MASARALAQVPSPSPSRGGGERGREGDGRRVYRACINCHRRKTKCDLQSNDGLPPCQRCAREHRECILCPPIRSRRRTLKTPHATEGSSNQSVAQVNHTAPTTGPASSQWVLNGSEAQSRNHDRSQSFGSYPTAVPTSSGRSEVPSLESAFTGFAPDSGAHSTNYETQPRALEDTIAAATLRNTSDAIDILSEVAHSAQRFDRLGSVGDRSQHAPMNDSPNFINIAPTTVSDKTDSLFNYKPFSSGFVSASAIHTLFENYERNFHPYFPIVQKSAFVKRNLGQLSLTEPHLFSAILTVAALDTTCGIDVQASCQNHMQQLISSLITGGSAGVEAVEALLILAEWVSHWANSPASVGKEKKTAPYGCIAVWRSDLAIFWNWTARLFFRITTPPIKHLSHEEGSYGRVRDPKPNTVTRLTTGNLVACYMCDRNISVRLGKAFWSRGPGAMIGLQSPEPSLSQRAINQIEDYATITQANLELTQLFSNAHDILYSRKGRGWKLMIEGDYVKYIDDFRDSIATWQKNWGTLICTPRLKSTLLLTYEFLRLYVNAFAYQATISRSILSESTSSDHPYCQLPAITAATPDARFIYESIEAAKSLLTTLNTFVDAEQCLRYMPSRFYLFIIYSAVFLYKAWSTSTMNSKEKTGVRHLIHATISSLERASVGPNHMGSRYSRLLHLLWRATPTASDTGTVENVEVQYGTFSWLDLEAVGTYATMQNHETGRGVEDNFNNFIGDFNYSAPTTLFTDYRWLSDENSNMIF